MVAERVSDAARRCPSSAGATAPGVWQRDVTVSELDAVTGDTPVVLITGDGHNAWLNTTALMHLAMPVRDSVVRETEWFAVYPRLVTALRQRRHLAGGVPPHPRRGGCAGRRRHGRLRVRRQPRGLDRALGAGLRRAAGPLGDVRRHPRRGDRRRPAHRRPAARLRRPGHDGTAQDHQRRLAQHPDRLVLRAVLRRAPAGVPRRPAEPLRRRAARPARAAPTAAASRSPPTRSATPRSPRRCGVRRHRGDRLDRARPAGRPRRRTPDGRARRPGQRPAGPPARRPRPHRAGLAGAGGALLRVPLDARRRRGARARLGRAGLAARPVAGDRGRRAPQRRRAATPGTASRRSPPPRRWPRPSTASRPSGSARPATWSSSTPTRWPCTPTRPRPARRSAPCRSP